MPVTLEYPLSSCHQRPVPSKPIELSPTSLKWYVIFV